MGLPKQKEEELLNLQDELKEMFTEDHTLLLCERYLAVIGYYEKYHIKDTGDYRDGFTSWESVVLEVKNKSIPHFEEVGREIRAVIRKNPQFKKNSAWLTKQEISRKYGDHYKNQKRSQGQQELF